MEEFIYDSYNPGNQQRPGKAVTIDGQQLGSALSYVLPSGDSYKDATVEAFWKIFRL